MYEIIIEEKKYINEKDSVVKVSFELPGHDWFEWLLITLLLELLCKYIQYCYTEY